MVSDDGTEAVVDSPENAEALGYVQSLLDSGAAAYSSQLGAGWGGEAFGTQKAAMTIEGSWISGAMTNDYPDVSYTVAPLPAGPAGPGTLAFTNCWGVAQASDAQDDAVALVEDLTSDEQQLEFAQAFGVIPSTQAAAEQYKTDRPEWAPFIDAADVAQVPPNQRGAADVITDFNAQLETLADGDPASILSSIQTELQAVIDDQEQ
jgi:multiple sugar transport system substrate-binding protein